MSQQVRIHPPYFQRSLMPNQWYPLSTDKQQIIGYKYKPQLMILQGSLLPWQWTLWHSIDLHDISYHQLFHVGIIVWSKDIHRLVDSIVLLKKGLRKQRYWPHRLPLPLESWRIHETIGLDGIRKSKHHNMLVFIYMGRKSNCRVKGFVPAFLSLLFTAEITELSRRCTLSRYVGATNLALQPERTFSR